MTPATAVPRVLQSARLVCWDFDGVIKESVDVKTEAFAALFADAGPAVVDRVRAHHLAHLGVSRFDKMPVYLGWAGVPVTAETVSAWCGRFADAVRTAVVQAPWVDGVEAYLRGNPHCQHFAVVTATPQPEMEWILGQLAIDRCFVSVTGAPTTKAAGIRAAMTAVACAPEATVMVGDAEADWAAARQTGVGFVWRRRGACPAWATGYDGPVFEVLADAATVTEGN